MRTLFSLFLLFIFFGCSTPKRGQYYQASPTDPNRATLYVYREPTSMLSLDPDIPFLYVNNNEIGKLSIGGYYKVTVDPGETLVFMKESMLGFSTWTSVEIKLNTIVGKSYYIKFTKWPFKNKKFLGLIKDEQALKEISQTELLINH